MAMVGRAINCVRPSIIRVLLQIRGSLRLAPQLLRQLFPPSQPALQPQTSGQIGERRQRLRQVDPLRQAINRNPGFHGLALLLMLPIDVAYVE